MAVAPVRKMSWWAWPILAAMLGGLGFWIYHHPWVLLLFFALVVLVRIHALFDTRRRRRLAASREDKSICDFARSFDRRKADTWIVRAVYDELSRYISVDAKAIPVCAADRCEKDLKIDPEDLGDLAENIAFRARRSMSGVERNPLYGKVETVADIVSFLEHQPRTVEPSVLRRARR
jgi:hypothetical protein